MRSIEEQIAAMQSSPWSEFAVTKTGARSATWEGTISPQIRKSYLLRIRYSVPNILEHFTAVGVQPRVQVLKPVLEGHPDYEEGPIPHVYQNQEEPQYPYLCLFDPYEGEWSPNDLISETTMYWAANWLYFYENWLLTGKWQGGGRHYGNRPKSV